MSRWMLINHAKSRCAPVGIQQNCCLLVRVDD